MAVRLVYETHATTVDNESGVATGWLPGELSAAGRENALDLGRRRRHDGLDLVVTSDLARAVDTCRIAFAGSGLPVREDRRLRECDYGELNGARVERVHAERRSHVDVPFRGGQSYREVTGQVRGLLEELLRDHDGQRVLLVGHAATRFALDHLLTGRPLTGTLDAPFAWREGWEYEVTGSWPDTALLDGAAALEVAAELTDVYRAAFTLPPYGEDESTVTWYASEQLPAHTSREGFRCATVRVDGALLGFCYGYTGRRGQWWTDQVAAGLAPQVAEEWLGGHLEIVELAVVPTAQRRGYAAALLDLVLEGAEPDRALLTTWADDRPDQPAPRLYRRLGWTLLRREVLTERDLWGRRLRT